MSSVAADPLLNPGSRPSQTLPAPRKAENRPGTVRRLTFDAGNQKRAPSRAMRPEADLLLPRAPRLTAPYCLTQGVGPAPILRGAGPTGAACSPAGQTGRETGSIPSISGDADPAALCMLAGGIGGLASPAISLKRPRRSVDPVLSIRGFWAELARVEVAEG
jgi:hypothetical protein